MLRLERHRSTLLNAWLRLAYASEDYQRILNANGADWAMFMVPKAKKKLGKVIAIALLILVAIIGLGWIFVVPRELKTIIGFSQWHDSHVRASGYVERELAGTRVYWHADTHVNQRERVAGSFAKEGDGVF